jgi:hypothetical protein
MIFRAAVDITAGQCVSLSNLLPGVVPCDNSVASPLPCIGVAITSAVKGTNVTVVVNGGTSVPNLSGRGGSAGQFYGDVDGSGILQPMGAAFDVSQGPFSYAGIGEGVSADLQTLYLIVQPGYVPSDMENVPALASKITRF